MKIKIYLLVIFMQFGIICNAQTQVPVVKEPFGKVKIGKGKNQKILDFDFPIVYGKDTCSNDLRKLVNDFFEDNKSLNYSAPKFEYGKENVLDFIISEVQYPKFAMENALEGRVVAHFEISENGVVENIRITRGVHVYLDKELFRIIRNMKFSSPAQLNGKNVRICTEVPLVFELGERK